MTNEWLTNQRIERLQSIGLELIGECDECSEEKVACKCEDFEKFLDLTDHEVFVAFSCDECDQLFDKCICDDDEADTSSRIESANHLEEDANEDVCPHCEESVGFCQCEEEYCAECGGIFSDDECVC